MAIFADRIADNGNNLKAYPFVRAYLKLNPERRSLQTVKAIWQYHNGQKKEAIKTIEDYKKLVPETGLDVLLKILIKVI